VWRASAELARNGRRRFQDRHENKNTYDLVFTLLNCSPAASASLSSDAVRGEVDWIPASARTASNAHVNLLSRSQARIASA